MKSPLVCWIAGVALWLGMLASGLGAAGQQVTVDISGLLFENHLDQSATSLPAEVEPAAAYSYSINATVHGTGLFGDLFGNGTPLAVVLDFIQQGSASELNGTIPDLSGTLPLVLLHQVYGGSIDFLGLRVASSGVLDLSLDSFGAATASISDVNVDVNGSPEPSDTIVIEPGSTITVTAVLPPVAVTGSADAISTGGATLNGAVNPEGAVTTGSFEWGTDDTYGNSVPLAPIPAGLDAVAVSATLSGLSAGSPYHYAIFAANLTGTFQSGDATFQTAAPPPPGSPSVTTGAAAGITYTTGTLGATVNPNGFDTTVVFEYGLDASYGLATAPVDSGSGNDAVSVAAAVANLEAGRTYHFTAVATNTNGVVTGLDQTFHTPAGTAPSVVAASSSAVGLTSAILFGTVNPNGTDTTVTFEYGRSFSYGSAVEPSQDIGAGSGQVTFSGTLAGLQPGTLYHYCVQATNSAGPVTSADHIFGTTSVAFGSYQGKYTGLFLSDPISAATSGMFTVDIGDTGAFTASGVLGGKSVRFPGVFQQDGAAIVNLGKTGITAHLQLVGSGAARNITGTLSGSDTAIVTAPLAQIPAAAALYTIRMPAPSGPALPEGNGYGSLKVSASGAVTFAGKLGDGTPVTCDSLLLTGSTFPLYAPLYGKAGALIGNAVFETGSNGVLDASLTWIKPAAFSTPLALYGSAYAPPARGAALLSASSGAFLFTSGTESFDQSVTLSKSNKLAAVPSNPQKFKASIKPATGLFSGSIKNPATGRSVSFGGAFFQDTNQGAGLIETGSQPGAVTFEPGQ